jgi:hypothetical protein
MMPSVPSFWKPGRPLQGLVGDVLPQPFLADFRAGQVYVAQDSAVRLHDLEVDAVVGQDLAHRMVHPPHGQQPRPGMAMV